MPDPTCLVNGVACPVDVTAGSTVNGALASTAGVSFWQIQCVSTDEQNTAAAVNATLTVNTLAKTFSFTAPASLGSALIFKSTVGIRGFGLDANGVAQPSYSTTFKVNITTAAGRRVIAANELAEQSPAAGWTAVVNDSIRNSSGTGNQGIYNVTLVNGLNSNVATTGLSTALLGGPTADFSIDGISTTAATPAGLYLALVNTTPYRMTIVDTSTSVSSAGNKIATGTANSGNVVVRGGGRVILHKDTINSEWQLIHAGEQTPARYDVREYFRAGDADDTQAIQRAADAAYAAGGGTVYCPNGVHNTTSPLVLSQGVTLAGESKLGTQITGNFYGPPVTFMQTPNPYAPALQTHDGISFLRAANADVASPWLNLSDCAGTSLRGLTVFSLECFVYSYNGGGQTGFRSLFQSAGQRGSRAWDYSRALYVFLDVGGALAIGLRTSAAGGSTTLSVGFTQPAAGRKNAFTAQVGSTTGAAAGEYASITGGGCYAILQVVDATHLLLQNLNLTPTGVTNVAAGTAVAGGAAITYSAMVTHSFAAAIPNTPANSTKIEVTYDGAHLGAWAGPAGGTCAFLGNVAVTGVVLQNHWELFVMGQDFTVPFAGSSAGAPDVDYASPRLSSVARHDPTVGASYTAESAQLVFDAQSYLCIDFSTLYRGTFVLGNTEDRVGLNSKAWFEVRNLALSNITECGVRDIRINSHGAALNFHGTIRYHVWNVYLVGGGLWLNNNCYPGTIDRLDIINGSTNAVWTTYALAFTDNASIGRVGACQIDWGEPIGVLVAGGAQELDRIYLTMKGQGQVGVYINQQGSLRDDVTVRGCAIGDEAGHLGEAGVWIYGAPSDTANPSACSFDGIATAVQCTSVDGAEAYHVDGLSTVKIGGTVDITTGMVGLAVVTPPGCILQYDVTSSNIGGPIIDTSQTALVAAPSYEGGTKNFTFAADADQTLTVNDSLWGCYTIAAGVIAAPRKLKRPYLTGRRFLVINKNAHDVTITEPGGGGTGALVAAGTRKWVIEDAAANDVFVI